MASAISGQSQPRQTSGYGLAAAVTATPTTSNERRFTTRQVGCSPRIMSPHTRVRRLIWSPAPRPSASAKPASTTTPPSRTQLAFGQLGLVDRGRCRVAPFCPHPRSTKLLSAQVSSGDAVRLELHRDHRVRPAVVDDAGSVGQCLQPGKVGGPAGERVPGCTGHHVGPGGGLPGALRTGRRSPRAGRARASAWSWPP